MVLYCQRVPGFEMNTSSIKSIKPSYKAKSGSKGSQMRGMSEYMKAEREAEKGASRTEAAPGSESGAGAAEEQSTRSTRQAVPKRP